MTRLMFRWGPWVGGSVMVGLIVALSVRSTKASRSLDSPHAQSQGSLPGLPHTPAGAGGTPEAVDEGTTDGDYFETASGRYHLAYGSREEDLSASGTAASESSTQAQILAKGPDANSPAAGATLPISVEVAAPSTDTPVKAPAPVPAGPLQVRWQVTDLNAAMTQVREWVAARQGLAVGTNEHHVSIRLLQADVVPFLEQFSPDAGVHPQPAASSTPALWVTISLELIAQP